MKQILINWTKIENYEPYEDEDIVLASMYSPVELVELFESPLLTQVSQKSVVFQALCCSLYDRQRKPIQNRREIKLLQTFLKANKHLFDAYPVPDYIRNKIQKLLQDN